jgi:MFS family permease
MARSRSLFFFLFYFIYFCSFWMVLAYLPLLLKSYQFSDSQIGFAIGLKSLSSILLVLPFGVFSDYFSPKRILTAGAVCFAVYLFLLRAIHDFTGICFALVLGGVGAATIRVVLMSLYLKLQRAKGRGKRVAFLQAGGYLGFALGPLSGGFIYEAGGGQTLIEAAVVLAMAVVVLTLFVKDVPPVVFSFREYKADLKKPDVLLLMAVIFVLGTHFGAEQTSISLLMKEVILLDTEEIGMVFFLLGIWMAVLVPFAGMHLDRRDSVFVLLLLGLVISSLFQIVTAFTQTFLALVVVRMIHTAGDTLAILESDVLTGRFFPAARLGGNSGLLFFVRTSAIFLFATFSGWLNQTWGYKIPFLVNGIVVMGFALTVLIWRGKRPLRRQTER